MFPLAALYSRQAVDLERRGMLARWLLPMSFPVSSGCTSMAKTMPSSEATDGDIFLAYIEQVLGPKLRPGDGVVMDNFSAHKVAGVEELIQAAAAELLYLPPYSPDLNPIEKAWAKLKQLLRTAKARTAEARTAEALDQAIAELLPQITPENAQAWFRHSGITYIS